MLENTNPALSLSVASEKEDIQKYILCQMENKNQNKHNS